MHCKKELTAVKADGTNSRCDEPVASEINLQHKNIWQDEPAVENHPVKRPAFKITWNNSLESTASNKYITSHVDFNSAFKNDNIIHSHSSKEPASIRNTEKQQSYLYCNNVCSDVPELDVTKEVVTIIVKANKIKHKIELNQHWTGNNIFKVLSHTLKIPLEKIKLIHKGKKVDTVSIASCIFNKAVFQAIGEQAENEDGIDKQDIDILMTQMSIERNDAIKALKENTDVLDAIMKMANKN